MLDRETVNLFSNTFASTFWMHWMHGRTIRFTSLLPHILFWSERLRCLPVYSYTP